MPAARPDIARLIDQMPDVDPPGKPGDPPPAVPPDPNRPGKFTGPPPETAGNIFDAILTGGRGALRELIRQVRAPRDPDFKNYKAGYLLHGLAIYVGRPGQEEERRLFSRTLAAELAADAHSPAAAALFIEELQVAGGMEAVQELGKLLLRDDLCEPAARALVAIGDGAADPLRGALSRVKGPNRLHLIQALGTLRDPRSVAALQQILEGNHPETRLAAAWALANIGAASAGSRLLEASDAAEGWERFQLTSACLRLAENLRAAGNAPEAGRIYAHLRKTRNDPAERHIREAAERALVAAPF